MKYRVYLLLAVPCLILATSGCGDLPEVVAEKYCKKVESCGALPGGKTLDQCISDTTSIIENLGAYNQEDCKDALDECGDGECADLTACAINAGVKCS